jgi:2-deoxy-D-gluconate 3-dehydrogenase
MILEEFSLSGKAALVTGSSTGLGQGMCIALAEAGADVAGVSRTDSGETGKRVESLGRKFLWIEADLGSLEDVDRVIQETTAAFGHLDILVNNAGMIRRGPALEFSVQDWDEVMDLNAKSLFFLCQAAARQFVKQGSRGKIINIASMLSFQGGVLVSSYTASKSAVLGITRILANEWASKNINVNAIAPGYMETNNTAPLRADTARNKSIVERIPAGRWGKPRDLAGAAVFLASEASNYVHGCTLAVDGGWLNR